MKTLLKNGFVYRMETHEFVKADILIENGIISDADYNGDDKNLDVIHCDGKYIIPGLVDVHTHGIRGHDFNTADTSACRQMRMAYAMSGTTTVMATLASAEYDSLVSSVDSINENRSCEGGIANIAGIHLEGRYLNRERRGAHAEGLLALPDADEIQELITRMLPLPVHISAAYELCGGEKFAKAAVELGATLGLAHSNATFDEAMRAVGWGVTSFTHTFNAMRPIHHREPGNMIASLMCDEAYTEIICDGEHVHPEMIKLARRTKPPDKLVLITDSMEATGCEDGEYSLAGAAVYVRNGKAVSAGGAIAGSTLTMMKALLNYMKFTGENLEKAVPCATANPARMVGIYDTCGSVAPGKRADLIITGDKYTLSVFDVIINGVKVKK